MPLRALIAAGITLASFGLTAGPAVAGGPTISLGATEDAVRAGDLVQTQAQLTMLGLAGMNSVRITSNWLPGLTAPTEAELATLHNIEGAALLTGIRVYVSVYSPGSKTTPLTAEAQSQFAAYTAALVAAVPSFDDIIVANEPNLNRFWLPQFNSDGTNASAPAYLSLLSQTYDAVKAVDTGVRIWGGATSPRGSDRPDGIRPTSSPTAFITALGAAYRASGRMLPIMDGYSHHPYLDNSAQSPDFTHPKSSTIALADYDKLESLLTTAFDGTAQPGSTLPILYDEFGIESMIPPGKASHYNGTEPTTTKPVDETTQAAAYQRGLQIAFCQPNVVGLLLFHTVDENELAAWQSGLYYADDTPKSSLVAVRDALRRTKGGSIARCPGLALDVTAPKVKFPAQAAFKRGVRTVKFTCTLDCIWVLRSIRASDGIGTARVRGYGRAGEPVIASLQGRKLGAQPVKLVLTLVHPVNPGTEWTRESAPARHALTTITAMAEAPTYERIEGLPVGQYVAYAFFKVDPAWRRLPAPERVEQKTEFALIVTEWQDRIEGLRAYSTVGVRPDTDFFLWKITESYDDLLELGAALNATALAGWLSTPHAYLATTKPSVYTDKKRVRQGKVLPRDAPYLVVYPFVKLRPWYFLTMEERRDAMREHAEVGGKYVTVTNHTTYSFGIDDQEFMPAFECDEPADFMHLMMALRETEASRWTERDTPIFVGALREIRAALDALDGASS